MAREQRIVVVSGMHRSNTSLLAQVLNSVGIRFGSQLVNASENNPHGHFEDIPLVKFHEAVLAENRSSWRAWRHRKYSVSENLDRVAREIVCSNTDDEPAWGFKVPHATLLLDYWAGYDQAVFVLIFRDPRSVIHSALRRIGRQVYYKPYFALNMCLTYCVYNERILDFARQEANRVHLVHNQDLLQSPRRTIEEIDERLQIGLNFNAFDSAIIDRSIKGMKDRMLARAYAKAFGHITRASTVYSSLLEHAERQRLSDSGAEHY